jgi:choline dehydrogenase-like flavoprotein
MHNTADLRHIRDANRRCGDPSLFSAHVNGTCRIGTSPRTSGCTPDGQVHGQPGLYVLDGSLLPTAPGVNPHETIAAITSILSQKLASTL